VNGITRQMKSWNGKSTGHSGKQAKKG